MTLKIRKTDDPILRQSTEQVTDFDDIDFQKLVDDMVETMRKENGIGLAAPQVGSTRKVLVCEYKGDKEENISVVPLTVLCNPEIVHTSAEEINMVEGCLSFPGLEILVKRPKKIKVKGQDRYGNNLQFEADKLYSRVLQHEIDHLNSTLLIDRMQKIDLIFIGSGTLGVPALSMLAIDPQYEIKMVVTGIAEAKSRNHKKLVNPIEEKAKELGLPILRTKDINNEKVVAELDSLKPTVAVMADFGQILSGEILSLPKLGIINIHPSLLPKHRGPSPIQQTILDGDKFTGVTLIRANEKMDEGGIISQVKVELNNTENATILKKYLAEIAANLLLNSLPYYIAGDLEPVPQDSAGVSYNKLFKKSDGLVDKDTSPLIVERKMRAFSDWPKVFTLINGKRIQLLTGHFDTDGELIIDLVKPEGKKEMTYDDFVRGYHTKLTFHG
ncbi:MAG: peptide deformylase [Patescibacteria group bacterium]